MVVSFHPSQNTIKNEPHTRKWLTSKCFWAPPQDALVGEDERGNRKEGGKDREVWRERKSWSTTKSLETEKERNHICGKKKRDHFSLWARSTGKMSSQHLFLPRPLSLPGEARSLSQPGTERPWLLQRCLCFCDSTAMVSTASSPLVNSQPRRAPLSPWVGPETPPYFLPSNLDEDNARFHTRVDVPASCAGRDPGDRGGLPGEGGGGAEPYSARGEGTLEKQPPPEREQPLWGRAEPLRRGPASGATSLPCVFANRELWGTGRESAGEWGRPHEAASSFPRQSPIPSPSRLFSCRPISFHLHVITECT